MKLTQADMIYDYYERHPDISITRDQLLVAMKEEGTKITKSGMASASQILEDAGHVKKAGKPGWRGAQRYKLGKLGYKSTKQTRDDVANQTEATKKRYGKIDMIKAAQKAEAELRYLMMCVSWKGQRAELFD